MVYGNVINPTDSEIGIVKGYFQTIRDGYSFEKMGSGIFPLIVTMQGLLGLSLTDGMNTYLRRKFEERRNQDYFGCLLPSLDRIANMLGGSLGDTSELNSLTNSNFSIDKLPEGTNYSFARTEGELLDIMANLPLASFKKSLPEDTKRRIIEFKEGRRGEINGLEHKIRAAYLPFDKLDYLFSCEKERLPVNGMLFKIKSYESIVIKQVEKLRLIYSPTEEELALYFLEKGKKKN